MFRRQLQPKERRGRPGFHARQHATQVERIRAYRTTSGWVEVQQQVNLNTALALYDLSNAFCCVKTEDLDAASVDLAPEEDQVYHQ